MRDDEQEVIDVMFVGHRLHAAAADRDVEFTTFMSEHADELRYTAWLLVGNAERADELVQQALVRTYGAWSRARGDPLAYARRVLVNLRTDTWRRRRREVLTAPEDMPDTPTGATAPDRAEDRDRLVRALARLTARQRRVVVLRYLVDLSEADVAAELGITVGTVKSTASRSLALLRTALGDYLGSGSSGDSGGPGHLGHSGKAGAA